MLDKRHEAIQAYLVAIRRALARGDSTEHTHRPALIDLVHALVKGVHCVNEPKGQKHGHPDIKVTLGETPIGYIETKDVGLDLAEIAESVQLRRYLREIPNLLLTDYLTFIWFENGHERMRANLAALTGKDKVRANEGQADALADLLDAFCQAEVKTIASPKELAQKMAALARMTRRLIAEALAAEPGTGDLHAQLKAFREVLLPDIDETKFADMYAQTICYGLFAGICNSKFPQTFARENAADNLPPTNPFLRQLFHHIVGPELNEKVRSAVDQIVFLLRHADVQAILQDFGKRTRKEDPVVHFYETFLAEYDPKLRKSRGVYYTPEPVVSYIVRSVDWLLKEKFGKPEGLADPSVLVLDPACGTGTFLYAVIKLIHERISAKGQYGAWSGYVRGNLLPRIFGFELLMAPYAVAHLKLGLLLHETGYDFGSEERLGVFLTNTLEEAAKKSETFFAEFISRESNAASTIKKDEPVMVVLGNPPYSNFGMMNKGKWILDLLEDYKKDLNEKKLNLDDDYIKFIRWGQWRIDRTGSGILAYISNSTYLDGVTHRGMRKSLLGSFDDVHLVDLHGSTKRKEVSPDGSKDENVFDIQQGVAVGIFAKSGGAAGPATVRHADIWGMREPKYAHLAAHSLDDTTWHQLSPEADGWFLVPRSNRYSDEYGQYSALVDALVLQANGVGTDRDALFYDEKRAVLVDRMRIFFSPDALSDPFAEKYGVRDSSSYNLLARRRKTAYDDRHFVQCLYRPFDTRWLYYDPELTSRAAHDVMQHMLRPNLALLTTRLLSAGLFRHVLATRLLADRDPLSLASRERTQVFPLYVYAQTPRAVAQQRFGDDSLWPAGKDGRRPNLNPKFVAEMEAKLGLTFVPEQEGLKPQASSSKLFGPEDVFDYIYATLHSPTYRKRYAEFLKIDFPRVPLTSDKKLFWKLVALGRVLVALHLLESPKVNDFVTKYPKKGSDTVEKVQFTPSPQPSPRGRGSSSLLSAGEEAKAKRSRSSSIPSPLKGEGEGEGEFGRVYINNEQYFEGVKPEWFEFHIGGYQVLQKWLKDRKGRKLSNDDITHYQRVVVAIKETIRLMSEIDKAIPKWPIE